MDYKTESRTGGLYQCELFAEVNQDFPGRKGLLMWSKGWELGQQRFLLTFFVRRCSPQLILVGVKATD